MKPISELNHYEVLEVAPGAPPDEIERAWRLARSTYDEESLAVYSVYGEDEARQIRERIDEAWQVLRDVGARSAYDAELPAEEGGAAAPSGEALPGGATAATSAGSAESPGSDPADLPLEISLALDEPEGLSSEALGSHPIPSPMPGDGNGQLALPATPAAAASPAPLPPPLPELEAGELDSLEDDAHAPYDGPRLRRSRLQRGLDIEHIARVTKINPSYLRFIEDERFDDLPAPVYVRGFVSAMARCIGLDAERAAGSYMERFQAARVVEEPPRGRGRRRR